jgi:uncharacterized membrane protein YhaH (DUF805 family)
MSFTEAVRTCLNKYVTISGRARRSEYWWWFLFVLLGSMLASLIDAVLFGAEGGGLLNGLFGLATILPSICVGGRRLHDRDMTAWWLLLGLIPVLGTIALLVLFAMRGTDGPNRFGPDPLAP